MTSAASGDRRLALALAAELDKFLAGDETRTQVGQIEGAIARAEPIVELVPSFEDLEYAVAAFAPGEGPEYVDEPALAAIARLVRRELSDVFGV